MNKKILPRCIFASLLAVPFLLSPRPGGSADMVQNALDDTTFTWRSLESANAQIYYHPGSFAEKHRAMLLRSVTATIGEVLEFLGETGYDRVLRVFCVGSREEMKQLTGYPVTGFAHWGAGSIFLVINPDWRSFEKHEIAHVFSMDLWGSPNESSRWMVEGLAISCDGWCREYSVDEMASYYLSGGQLPPLRELFDNYRSLGEIRGGFYAASVIGYIHDAYGPKVLRELWLGGHEKLAELTGASIDDIESSWKQYLSIKVPADVEIDPEKVNDLGCG